MVDKMQIVKLPHHHRQRKINNQQKIKKTTKVGLLGGDNKTL